MNPTNRRYWSVAVVFCAMAMYGPFAARAAGEKPSFTVRCDQATGIYASGQLVVFTVEREGEENAEGSMEILFNNRESVLREAIPSGEKTHTLRFPPPKDGWYVCAAALPGDKKTPRAATGVIVNPDGYSPSLPAPDDFDAFWAAQRARLAAEKVEAQLTPLTPEQTARETENPALAKLIGEWKQAGCTASSLEIPCLDVKPLRGYYARPKSPKPKGHAAILYFRAAGVAGDWCRASLFNALDLANRNDALVVDLNAHGMLNGQPQPYYAALDQGELRGYQTQGREDRDQFYFLGMFLRLMRAIDFLCAQPEWDGVHLVCIGTSQGGGQALAAAGLDPRVTAVLAMVPALCDLTGPAVQRPGGWPGGIGVVSPDDEHVQKTLQTYRYFDAVNFCARSKARTFMATGLIDTTCPSPGVFIAYNQLKTQKRIVSYPPFDHKGFSGVPSSFKKDCDAFVLEQTHRP